MQTWVEQLGKQQGFTAWKQSTTSITPIGPGQHGWLVTLRDKAAKPVGYLIVHAKEDGGFQLSEYGSGSHPAYDPNTLYQSMIQQGLISSYADALLHPLKLERLYMNPLLAVWKWDSPDGQTYYLDAWTGEALPIDDKQWLSAGVKLKKLTADGSSAPSAAKSISLVRMNPTFDAYEQMPWLTKKPLETNKVNQLTQLLDRQAKIRFTSELYDRTVLFVWPAIGYHQWNDQKLYVAFDQYGMRYVALADIQSQGLFFNE